MTEEWEIFFWDKIAKKKVKVRDVIAILERHNIPKETIKEVTKVLAEEVVRKEIETLKNNIKASTIFVGLVATISIIGTMFLWGLSEVVFIELFLLATLVIVYIATLYESNRKIEEMKAVLKQISSSSS